MDKDHKISFYIDEEDGRYTLHTNLYEYLPRNITFPINSEVLGVAFEPEARFENPDGSEIVFDRDYFGRKRGIKPVAGPFEECRTDRFTVQTPGFGSYLIRHQEKARISEKKDESGEILEEVKEKKTTIYVEPTDEAPNLEEIQEPNFTIDEDEFEQENKVSEINSNVLLTGCDACGIKFPFEGGLFQVSDMFVKGNEVWLYDNTNEKLVEE